MHLKGHNLRPSARTMQLKRNNLFNQNKSDTKIIREIYIKRNKRLLFCGRAEKMIGEGR